MEPLVIPSILGYSPLARELVERQELTTDENRQAFGQIAGEVTIEEEVLADTMEEVWRNGPATEQGDGLATANPIEDNRGDMIDQTVSVVNGY
jgi:hypothetical protein